MKYFSGDVMSEGVAVGPIHHLEYQFKEQQKTNPEEEKEKILKAIHQSIEQLEELLRTDREDESYLTIQVLVLKDTVLKQKIFTYIDQGFSAYFSLSMVMEEFKKSLLSSASFYLQERTMDFSDIEMRITRNLVGNAYKIWSSKFILVTKELYPSYLIQNKKNILGIISLQGGYNSHGAILCRQLNIPYIRSNVDVMEGQMCIMDTRKQQIMVSPDASQIKQYEQMLESLSNETFSAVPHRSYKFLANVSTNMELDKVLQYGFDGIGLYRTEMIFMNADRPLTLQEQYEIYSEAIHKFKDKSICFRTFDIGDDKQLSYARAYKKGIENYIYNKSLFETQIQALIKANHYNHLQIMFPMIASHDEFVFLKNWVKEIQKNLQDESSIKMGIMLETKEALERISEFRDVDFISIGTNDLILSIYHIHRDLQTTEMKQYLHDLIFKLKQVVEFCDASGIGLSICGELASIEPALREFMKIGVKNYSVAAPAIKVLNHIYKEFH